MSARNGKLTLAMLLVALVGSQWVTAAGAEPAAEEPVVQESAAPDNPANDPASPVVQEGGSPGPIESQDTGGSQDGGGTQEVAGTPATEVTPQQVDQAFATALVVGAGGAGNPTAAGTAPPPAPPVPANDRAARINELQARIKVLDGEMADAKAKGVTELNTITALEAEYRRKKDKNSPAEVLAQINAAIVRHYGWRDMYTADWERANKEQELLQAELKRLQSAP